MLCCLLDAVSQVTRTYIDFLFTPQDDLCVRVFNYNTLEYVIQFPAHVDFIRCVVIHPSSPFVFTAGGTMLLLACISSFLPLFFFFCQFDQHVMIFLDIEWLKVALMLVSSNMEPNEWTVSQRVNKLKNGRQYGNKWITVSQCQNKLTNCLVAWKQMNKLSNNVKTNEQTVSQCGNKWTKCLTV